MALFARTNPIPEPKSVTLIAFAGSRRVASGSTEEVARAAKAVLDAGGPESVLIFDAQTSRPVEIDFRGTASEVVARLALRPAAEPAPSRGPGRPKLGVVAREVTLLPRHWDWLSRQPGGASVALRKLVEDARKGSGAREQRRLAQEAAYRFMSAMAGNGPGFEEATRALFAGQAERFHAEIAPWPEDIRTHAAQLAIAVFAE